MTGSENFTITFHGVPFVKSFVIFTFSPDGIVLTFYFGNNYIFVFPVCTVVFPGIFFIEMFTLSGTDYA